MNPPCKAPHLIRTLGQLYFFASICAYVLDERLDIEMLLYLFAGRERLVVLFCWSEYIKSRVAKEGVGHGYGYFYAQAKTYHYIYTNHVARHIIALLELIKSDLVITCPVQSQYL
jgi:hypothetical protein